MEKNWTDLNLSPEMMEIIQKAGYEKPSPVQGQAIPLVMAGHDVLVSSQTGSGKTASFVIPTIERFKGKNGTYILALAPTREIAQQTGLVFEAFGEQFGMKTVVCIGGASMQAEKDALASSPHIIVATPGRLSDHLERGNVWLEFIQCLIFDEADRMLDMGFAKQIEIISTQIPKERQTLMFSATFAPSVEKLARDVMKDPKEVTIEKTLESAPKIDERLFWVNEDRKLGELLRILRKEDGTVFVFVNSKEKVFRVWRALQNKQFEEATYIHSDLAQEQREQAIADFKSGKFRVLIATDVAGRGIDVDDVAHVVNWDVPREAEDYVHRIGRTGRRGRTGKAATFAIPQKDDRYVRAIEKLLNKPAAKRDETPRNERPRDERPNRERSSQGPRQNKERRPQQNRPRTDNLKDIKPNTGNEPRKAIVTPEKKSGGIVQWLKNIFKK
jgi:superfamily II DNA/RNA helicase